MSKEDDLKASEEVVVIDPKDQSEEPIQNLADYCEELRAKNRALLDQILEREKQKGRVLAATVFFCLFKKSRITGFDQLLTGDDIKKILQACEAHKCHPLATDEEKKGWDEVVNYVRQSLGENISLFKVLDVFAYLYSIREQAAVIVSNTKNRLNFVPGPGSKVLM